MIYSILYLILAAVGLGVLVFIHELGHYFMARKEGMKIEAFSIGFGKAIVSWEKDGVKWKICWIPVGGYVKIAGMEKKGSLEPYEIENGFYGKKPLARIKVALAGPIVNIVFALVLFSLIWVFGGREKPFSFSTHLIGWVDPSSALYKSGVRPGDEISSYGNKVFQGFMQFQTSTLIDKDPQVLKGEKIDYEKGLQVPFVYRLDLGWNVKGKDKFLAVNQLMGPASYLIYHEDSITSESPMKESGIVSGDRVIWIDGEFVFSRRELVSIINEQRVLLTVQRGDSVFFTKVPRLQIEDLRINYAGKADIHDWAYARQLKEDFSSLYFIPYKLTSAGRVEGSIPYLDEGAVVQDMFVAGSNPVEIPLLKGDVIRAVDGKPVVSGEDILQAMQSRHVQIIVQRGEAYPPISWKKADESFMKGISFEDLHRLSNSIGAETRLSCSGSLCLLAPVEPKPFSLFGFTPSVKEKVSEDLAEQRKRIETIQDDKERELALKAFDQDQHRLLLGAVFEDRKIYYNPSPWSLFMGVFDEIQRTITALFTGYLSPKYMLGPVGIVGAMQQGWGFGIKEALFLVGMISMNLGFVNLLPIPVLDGGHICFACYEALTKKRIKAKTMERLIIPFIVLIILFFLYVTYNDILRIF